MCLKIAFSFLVTFVNSLLIMRISINFDDEFLLNAQKIHNVWTNGNLAAKFESAKAIGT